MLTLLTWRVIHIVYWIMHDVLFFCDNIIVIVIYTIHTFYFNNMIDNILKGKTLRDIFSKSRLGSRFSQKESISLQDFLPILK